MAGLLFAVLVGGGFLLGCRPSARGGGAAYGVLGAGAGLILWGVLMIGAAVAQTGGS